MEGVHYISVPLQHQSHELKYVLFLIFHSIVCICFLCHPCSALAQEYLMGSIQQSFSVTANAGVVPLR